MDKAGNFIGWLHIDGANLSVLLVEHALSKVHFTAERSAYYKSLLSAEEAAKQKKEKVRWNQGWQEGGGYRSAPGSPLPCTLTPQPPRSRQNCAVVPQLGTGLRPRLPPKSGTKHSQGPGGRLRCPQP